MIMVNCVVYPEYLFARADSLECSAFGVAAFASEFARTETYVDHDQR
jgi:hypothetical protein